MTPTEKANVEAAIKAGLSKTSKPYPPLLLTCENFKNFSIYYWITPSFDLFRAIEWIDANGNSHTQVWNENQKTCSPLFQLGKEIQELINQQ